MSTFTDIRDAATGKDLIEDPVDYLINPLDAVIEGVTGVNSNPLEGVGGANDFFERPWTDRTLDGLKDAFSGKFTKEDFLNPGSAFWNPAGQLADPGNFLDKESVKAWAETDPEMRDVLSAIVAGGVASAVLSPMLGAGAAPAAGEGSLAAAAGAGAGPVAVAPGVTSVIPGGGAVATVATGTGLTAGELAGLTLGTTAITTAADLYANDKAADAASDAADKANETQLDMYEQSREDTAPWREAGENALGRLEDRIGAGPGQFSPQADPGYKFGYEEFVEKPLLRNAAGRNGLGGGRTGKELTRYASDYASTKYDDFLNRWYQSLAPDQAMAGLGQTAAMQQGQNSMSIGRDLGQNLLTQGSDRATGYQNQASIIGSTISGLSQNALDLYFMDKYGSRKKQTGIAPTNQPNMPTQHEWVT